MTPEELTAAQDKFIETARASVERIEDKAAEADRLGLGVLAREYHHIAGELDRALTLQVKTLKGNVPEGFQ